MWRIRGKKSHMQRSVWDFFKGSTASGAISGDDGDDDGDDASDAGPDGGIDGHIVRSAGCGIVRSASCRLAYGDLPGSGHLPCGPAGNAAPENVSLCEHRPSSILLLLPYGLLHWRQPRRLTWQLRGAPNSKIVS